MPGTLIMDLTLEQGGGRESQVQPPKNVWVQYFGIDLDNDPDDLPELVVQDRKHPPSDPEHRRIVYHDHNWTLEFGDAGMPRPAILRMVRVAPNSYNYWVYRDGDPEYNHVNWILDNIPNPQRIRGRRWVSI